MNITEYNKHAWDHLVAAKNKWTVPVGRDQITQARNGIWEIALTPAKTVPREWFGDIRERSILCLAGAGGQQGPILAAAGARVTVFDNSPKQLAQDAAVADSERLPLEILQGDMRDLSIFEDGRFDLIVHPVSNCFVSNVRPVWNECYRVLRIGGCLLAGFCNPLRYIFDAKAEETGKLEVRHAIPYSDATDLSDEERQRFLTDRNQPLEFGHALEDQIGGQIDAGFVITGFYEDRYDVSGDDLISKHISTFIATRALK